MTVNVDCTRSEFGYHGPVNSQGMCPWCQCVLWPLEAKVNVNELMKQLSDIAAEGRNAEVVIYPETYEVSKFLGIKGVHYDEDKNIICINAENLLT